MASAAALLQLLDISKRFQAPDGSPHLTILNSLSLQIQSGEFVAVIGPSGSGKSTLLHLMGGLDRPTSGKIIFQGEDLATLDEPRLAAVRNQQIGFVFQSHYLLPQCTVLENVLVPTLAAGRSRGTTAEQPSERRAQDLLRRLGLHDRLAHLPGQLSGGERQRVAVARALINRPSLLLADEPTGSLDQASAHELGFLLSELNQEQQVTIVLVTHSPALAGNAGRILLLSGGKLVSQEAQTPAQPA